MLTTKINHFFGSQERHDLQLVRLILDTTDLDEKEALENGWLLANNEWYQARSVRINIDEFLDKYKVTKFPPNIKLLFYREHIEYHDYSDIKEIFEQFCMKKGFDASYNLFSDIDRAKWLIVYDDDIPVAFTKMILYKGGVESQFTAWNYHKPKLSIGKKLVYYEICTAFAGLNIDDYLYIGQGYEQGSMYKSDFPGFEWWTGSEWSKDRDEYKRLCISDSSINTLDDLSKVYNHAQIL